MKKTIKQRIVDLNRKWNGLEYDPELELKMLQEEAYEFFTADTFVQRLQEYSDFKFVWEGTKVKFYAFNTTVSPSCKPDQIKWFESVFEWATDIQRDMVYRLRKEMEANDILDGTRQDAILKESMKAVVTANESKIPGLKDANGKTRKGPFYQRPYEKIKHQVWNHTGMEVE